jgi:hypothetical protein
VEQGPEEHRHAFGEVVVSAFAIPAGARIPIGDPPQWLAAAELAGWQCQCTTSAKGQAKAGCGRSHWEDQDHRCPHKAAGECAMRLILAPDHAGVLRLLCETCANGHARKAASIAAALPEPDPEDLGQGSLFDLLEAGAA